MHLTSLTGCRVLCAAAIVTSPTPGLCPHKAMSYPQLLWKMGPSGVAGGDWAIAGSLSPHRILLQKLQYSSCGFICKGLSGIHGSRRAEASIAVTAKELPTKQDKSPGIASNGTWVTAVILV